MNRSMTETHPARTVRADAFVAQMRSADRAAIVRAIEQQDVAELERAAIASRIKQARLEAGLSQPEMADAVGVIARTYQNYESASNPRTPWGLMNQIATVTGKTTEWLIHGEGTETPDLMAVARSSDDLSSHLQRLEEIALQNQRLLIAVATATGLSEQPAAVQARRDLEPLLQRIEAEAGQGRRASQPGRAKRRHATG